VISGFCPAARHHKIRGWGLGLLTIFDDVRVGKTEVRKFAARLKKMSDAEFAAFLAQLSAGQRGRSQASQPFFSSAQAKAEGNDTNAQPVTPSLRVVK